MKKIISAIIVFIIVSSSILIVLSVGNLKKKIKIYKENYNDCIGSKLESEYQAKVYYQNSQVLNELTLSKINNVNLEQVASDKGIKLNEISQDPILIYWFDYAKACKSCVDNAIQDLVAFYKSIGSENIAIITNYEDLRQLRILQVKFGISFSCYSTKEILSDKLQNNSNIDQLIFVLDKNLRILFPAIVNNTNPVSIPYLNKVKDYLINRD